MARKVKCGSIGAPCMVQGGGKTARRLRRSRRKSGGKSRRRRRSRRKSGGKSRRRRRSRRRSSRRSRSRSRRTPEEKTLTIEGKEEEVEIAATVTEKKPSKKARVGKKRKMNAFFMAKEKARKSGAATFSYKGKTYHKKKLPTGMIVYSSKK